MSSIDTPTAKFGDALRQQVEERLNFFETGEPPSKNADAMRKVFESLALDVDEDEDESDDDDAMAVDGAAAKAKAEGLFPKTWKRPLDASLYAPDEDEAAFMRAATRIADGREMKEHILASQRQAYAVSTSSSACTHFFLAFRRVLLHGLWAYTRLKSSDRTVPLYPCF